MITSNETVEAFFANGARAVLLSQNENGEIRADAVDKDYDVLNIERDLLAHMMDYPFSDAWLFSIRDAIDQRLACRQAAKASGSLAVPSTNGTGYRLMTLESNVVEIDDGASEWINGVYVGPERPLPPGEIKATLEHLLLNVAYLRSWFAKHERMLELVEGLPLSSVYDNFVEASASAKCLARVAGIVIDHDAIRAHDWTPKTRPQRPDVGPQARYTMTGDDIALHRDPTILFKEGKALYEAGLEWILYHLERFDEPSRHSILASTAAHFGIPFDVLMGDTL